MGEQLSTALFDTSSEDTVYRIPVVIHVIHNGEPLGTGTNIDEGQLLSQIEVLNEDFRRLNKDTVNTPEEFLPVAADTRIEFVLAKQDPEGLPTTGIVRVQGSKPVWNTADNLELKATSYWPAEDYLNIWVAPLSNTLLGYAQFPFSNLEGLEDGSNNRLTDGVVVKYNAFGSRDIYPDGFYDSGFDKGRTATHEIGHFLGLRHTSGDGGCLVDDFCADTPTMSTDYGNLSDCSFPNGNTCDDGPNDLPDMFQNFLSLAQDQCMNLFTENQLERMLIVLQNSPRRGSLLLSQGLQEPQVSNLDLGVRMIEIPLESTCPEFIPSVSVRNFGEVTITSASISLSIDGSTVETLDWAGVLEPLDSLSIAFSNQTLPIGGTSTVRFDINSVNGQSDDNPDNDAAELQTTVPSLEPLPLLTDFENNTDPFLILNPDGRTTWEVRSVPIDGESNAALFINLYDYLEGVGESDLLFSPFLNIGNAETLQLSFDVSYARFPARSDALLVAASKDCGNTFTDTLYYKAGSQLATVETGGNQPFTPALKTDWRTEVLDLTQFLGQDFVQLAFISINDAGNNIYLDNIRVNDMLLEEISIEDGSISQPFLVECRDVLTPTFTVQNTGTVPISSYVVSYQIPSLEVAGDTLINTNLGIGASEEIILLPFEVPEGNYELLIEISEPNGDSFIILPNSTARRSFLVDTRQDQAPVREDFEFFENVSWSLFNPDISDISIEEDIAPSESAQNNAAVARFFSSTTNGSRHFIVSPVLDLSITNLASLFFDVSYADRTGFDDKLNVYIIQDCTNPTFTLLQSYDASELSVQSSDTEWNPSGEDDWKQLGIDLTAFGGLSSGRIIFELVNDGGNSMFIDNIELFLSNDFNRPDLPRNEAIVYPNPAPNGKFNLLINLDRKEEVLVQIIGPTGRVISNEILTNSLNQNYPLDLSTQRQGTYLVRVSSPSINKVFRLFR